MARVILLFGTAYEIPETMTDKDLHKLERRLNRLYPDEWAGGVQPEPFSSLKNEIARHLAGARAANRRVRRWQAVDAQVLTRATALYPDCPFPQVLADSVKYEMQFQSNLNYAESADGQQHIAQLAVSQCRTTVQLQRVVWDDEV